MKRSVWRGTKEDYDNMMAARPVLPPIPRRELELPPAHVVDEPRLKSESETRATRMANHYQPYPDDQQDAAMQRMLNEAEQRDGRNCGDVLRAAKLRLTRDRLAVVEEAIRAYATP